MIAVQVAHTRGYGDSMADRAQLNVYLEIVEKNNYYSKGGRLGFYLKYLFEGVELKGKDVLDVGGGDGLFCFYAKLMGARRVVNMEPEFDGSTKKIRQRFYELKDDLNKKLELDVEFSSQTLQTYSSEPNQFDVILLHDSINHVDEEACISLATSLDSQNTYLGHFALLQHLIKPKGRLIVCDCSNKNFFHKLKLVNPFAPQIEWEKHQGPDVWARFLSKAGFDLDKVQWTSPNRLGLLGRALIGNFIGAYLTTSLFRMVLTSKKIDASLT